MLIFFLNIYFGAVAAISGSYGMALINIACAIFLIFHANVAEEPKD